MIFVEENTFDTIKNVSIFVDIKSEIIVIIYVVLATGNKSHTF